MCFSITFVSFQRLLMRVFYHMFIIAECTREEANLRRPIRGFQLPQMMRYALLGGEAREQDRRLSGVSGSGYLICT